MSRAKESTHVHAVADSLNQATDALTREWSTERRQRWIPDTDTPATDTHPQRPALATRPSPVHRAAQLEPEATALDAAVASAQQARIEQIKRRFDALQQSTADPDRGLGLG